MRLDFQPIECHKSIVKGLFGGGEDKAAKAAAEASRKAAEKQQKLLDEQKKQAELEAERMRLQNLAKSTARRAGTIGRKSLIATSELGVTTELG